MNKTKNQNQSKFTLYVGLNDKDSKKQIIKTSKAFKKLNNLLLNDYNLFGATIQQSKGIYKHANGKIIQETSFIITLLDVEESTINNIIVDLKTLFNQESILKEKNIINYAFI